jgi:hypothetical protein
MTTAKLRDLKSPDDIARACGVERPFIEEYSSSQNQKSYYSALKIPKRGKRRRGEYRVVFAAREQRLAALHRSISMIVTNSIAFGDHVQGFLKKRSTRTNAERHLGATLLLHADIKGFFDAISTERVNDAFIIAGAPAPIADLLAKACTIDGLLRQGTRCSPTIANLVCLDMDQAFLQLAGQKSCIYTRYADDLTFSGDEDLTDEAVSKILAKYGFALRDGRCFRQYKGRCQFVTGLTVADHTRPRLPRRLKRQLRLTMHYIEKHGIGEHYRHVGSDAISGQSWLSGILDYAHAIEPELVKEWRRIFEAALADWDPDDQHDREIESPEY